MTQEEAAGSQGVSEVRVGIPTHGCVGYPAAEGAPPPRTAAPPPRTAAKNSHDYACFAACLECCYYVFLPTIIVIVISSVWYYKKGHNGPNFKVESISVSLLHNNNGSSVDSQLVTAKWNIEFSVRNSNSQSSLNFREFNVWVRCMSEGSSVAILPPLKQGHKNTTFLNATVFSSLSPDGVSRLIQGSEFDVVLRAKYESLEPSSKDDMKEVACKNMRVGFSPNATQGVMVGGPISCSTQLQVYNRGY